MSAPPAAPRRSRRKLTADDIRRSLASGATPAPYYLLHGEEGYARQRLVEWLRRRLRPEAAPEFNIDTYHADSFDPQRLLDTYFAYPMMAGHRLLILRDLEKLSPAHAKALEPLVEHRAETSVLLATGTKIDMRRRLFAQLASKGLAVEFRLPYDDKLPQAVGAIARDKGLDIQPEAIDLLCLAVSPRQLQEVAHELDKLAAFAGPGNTIEDQHVKQSLGTGRGGSIFDLTDAVGRGDARRAQQLLHDLLRQGEEPARLIPLLARHLQLLLRTQRLIARRAQRDEMARALGLSPFFLPRYQDQARHLSTAALWRGLSALRQADDLIKGGGRGRNRPQIVMDLCLAQLLGRLGG